MNPKKISYDILSTSGTTQDCFLTVSAWLSVGTPARKGICYISQDGANWYDIAKGMGTDYWDDVNGYCSPSFQGYVAKGTRIKFSHTPNEYVAYEFSIGL